MAKQVSLDEIRDAFRQLHEVAAAGAKAGAALLDAFRTLPPDGDGGEPMPVRRAA